MTKITILLTRRSDLSHEQFIDYWTQKHTPLLAELPDDEVTVSRYVQLQPTEDSIPGVQTAPVDGSPSSGSTTLPTPRSGSHRRPIRAWWQRTKSTSSTARRPSSSTPPSTSFSADPLLATNNKTSTKAQLMPFSRPEELHSTFANAIRRKDVKALLDLYEPNALVVLPDGTQLTDLDARREMLTGLIEGGSGMQGVPRKVLIADDIALTSTSYEVEAGAAGDRPTTVETAEISRRQADGSWRVVIDAPAFS